MTLSPGTTLGSYELEAPLGAGGMGEVWRARDPRLGRAVAIKVLPAAMSGDAARLARFEREARSVAALNHPHIVTIHSIEEAGGIRFLTMELIDGDTLDRLVAPGGLPVARAVDLAIALADALAAAHERGVIHRDLKPANVMVTRAGRLKVLDFGLAKLATEEPAGSAGTPTMADPVSSAGSVVGTVPYMAPEQVRGEAVDARADLFSFGILLYELVAGRRPFAGHSWADVTSSILRDTPVPLPTIRSGLPRDLERIVTRCLDKDRERRFQTAKDVRNELEFVRRGLDSAGPGAAPAPSAVPGTATASDSSATATPSIAVLPFANRSANEEDEYFSDGLADELQNVLAKIRGLRVTARTSSATFKGRAVSMSEVGKALQVATVLEGSVRRAGNRVRISVQLVQADDGATLWSETYDRTLDDIFAVQDDIAQSVVKELRTKLLGEAPDSEASREVKAEVAAAAEGRATNAESHRLYLQGRFLLDRLNEEETGRAIELLERAIELDPKNALAFVALSFGRSNQAGYGWGAQAERSAQARAAALEAIRLAPDLAEGHLVLGRVLLFHDFEWEAARACARRALELAPDSAEAHRLHGQLVLDLERIDEAIDSLRRATEIDPLSSMSFANLATQFRAAGRREEAIRAWQKSLELSPQRVGSHFLIAFTLSELGRLDEAMVENEREPAAWARLTGHAIFHHLAGRDAESRAALSELERDYAVESAFQIAAVHAVRGDSDAMFAWLERAVEQRDAGLAMLPIEPAFRPYHGDPRWAALRRRLRLDPA